jgi:hypothetical protein
VNFNVRRRSVSGLLFIFLACGSALAAEAQTGLKIVVLEGNGARAVIAKPAPKPIMVRVVDSSNRPVAGATVVFTAPANGPSSNFVNGSNSMIVFTNAQGVAMAQDYRANSAAGDYRIQVEAAYMGDVTTLAIAHTNVAPQRSNSRLFLIALAAGGAAGAVLATRSGDSSSSSQGSSHTVSTPPTITLLGSSLGGSR